MEKFAQIRRTLVLQATPRDRPVQKDETMESGSPIGIANVSLQLHASSVLY